MQNCVHDDGHVSGGGNIARMPSVPTHFLHCPTGACVDSSGADGETSVRIRIYCSEGHKNNQVRPMT